MKENLLCTYVQKRFQQAKSFLAEELKNGYRLILSLLASVTSVALQEDPTCTKSNRFWQVETIRKKCAFSLVEMLMALLVASLLLAALAPVITKKADGSRITINGFFNPNNNTVREEIIFDSENCPGGDQIQTAADGSQYCEGTYRVPSEYNGIIRVTVVGAGGGGGAAPTAGFTEFNNAGSTNDFTVPAMVNKLEATIIGGAPGGNASYEKIDYRIFKHPQTPKIMHNGVEYAPDANVIETKSDGTVEWKPDDFQFIKRNIINITACGGGGGGGGTTANNCINGLCSMSGGGGAGYLNVGSPAVQSLDKFDSSITIMIGGGGGGGAFTSSLDSERIGYDGGPGAGGGGGAGVRGGDAGCGGSGRHSSTGSGCAGREAGKGGSLYRTGYGREGGSGADAGEEDKVTGGQNYNTPNDCITNPLLCTVISGGKPNGGGIVLGNYVKDASGRLFFSGGGGGGSIKSGFGGGGGGGSFHGGGGGGGGAATRIIGSGYQWPAGGGGGGGCQAHTYAELTAGGGGGGAGSYKGTTAHGGNGAVCVNSKNIMITTGIGGTAQSVDAEASASGFMAGKQPSNKNIFGSNFCNGGNGVAAGNTGHGESGKPGAMKIAYLTSTGGGYGGSPAKYHELKPLSVEEKQILSLKIGEGTEGGKTSTVKVNETNLEIEKYGARFGTATVIKDKNSNTKLLETEINVANINGGGAPSKHNGGAGGVVNTVFTSCNAAEGGKVLGEKAANATGYGCGGGGAHSLSDAGDGSGGYARLSWNKYWDRATKAYKLANVGAGGGGASGNIMVYSLRVMGGQVIDIKIGKGGEGAKIINNNLIKSQKGGDTVFGNSAIGEIRAGGGSGGGSPSIENNNVINGAGGSISTICHYSGRSLFKNSLYCTHGSAGSTPPVNSLMDSILNGANGGSILNFGEGGEGGISGTNRYKGNDASGFGAGGGGAGIHDLGNNSINPLSGSNEGGKGSNGKIIIELFKN